MITRCPLPWFGARSGGPAKASGTRISPIATIVSYSAAAPPAAPTVSRKRRRGQFESLIANPPISIAVGNEGKDTGSAPLDSRETGVDSGGASVVSRGYPIQSRAIL